MTSLGRRCQLLMALAIALLPAGPAAAQGEIRSVRVGRFGTYDRLVFELGAGPIEAFQTDGDFQLELAATPPPLDADTRNQLAALGVQIGPSSRGTGVAVDRRRRPWIAFRLPASDAPGDRVVLNMGLNELSPRVPEGAVSLPMDLSRSGMRPRISAALPPRRTRPPAPPVDPTLVPVRAPSGSARPASPAGASARTLPAPAATMVEPGAPGRAGFFPASATARTRRPGERSTPREPQRTALPAVTAAAPPVPVSAPSSPPPTRPLAQPPEARPAPAPAPAAIVVAAAPPSPPPPTAPSRSLPPAPVAAASPAPASAVAPNRTASAAPPARASGAAPAPAPPVPLPGLPLPTFAATSQTRARPAPPPAQVEQAPPQVAIDFSALARPVATAALAPARPPAPTRSPAPAPRPAPQPVDEIRVRLQQIEFPALPADGPTQAQLLDLMLSVGSDARGDLIEAREDVPVQRVRLGDLPALAGSERRISGALLQEIVERVADVYQDLGRLGTRIDIPDADLDRLLQGESSSLKIYVSN